MSDIPRHKTALSRTRLSRPVRLTLEDGLLTEESSVLDYGCGKGGDVLRLRRRGFKAEGWDPVHRPRGQRRPADVVNLGYVVNVIEDPEERMKTLRSAWHCAERLLVVSARLDGETDVNRFAACADGLMTSVGTFQKFYQQSELRAWINETLEVAAVPAAPGVFYVFRDDTLRQRFIASRYRRRVSAPRIRQSDVLFEKHRPILEPLMRFFAGRGRLPEVDELTEGPALTDALGSMKKAFLVIRRITGEDQWAQLTSDRADDLRVHLALMKFEGRPKLSALPLDTQLDIKALFGTYRKACIAADELLFDLGNMSGVSDECTAAKVGKKLPTALYVHMSALDHLSPVLRAYEGCARQFLGAVSDATLVKLHREKPQVSYLGYPDFDSDPHPPLAWSLTVNLQTFRVRQRSYVDSDNPPILHRKELFVGPEYPRRATFKRLTDQEERWGLYSETHHIGHRNGWQEVLRRWGVELRGHRLVTTKT